MNLLRTKLNLKLSIPISQSPTSPITISNYHSECSHIIDNIYLSGYQPTLDEPFLHSKHITHIINCAGGSKTFTPLFFEGIHYKTIHLKDDSMSNLSLTIQEFITYIKHIEQYPSTTILIHCYEGISRAPALVCAYLIWKKRMSLAEAIAMLKQKRECIDINLSFMCQLEKFYLQLSQLK